MCAARQSVAARLEDADANVRALALDELVKRGNAATSILVQELRAPRAETRALAAQGLGVVRAHIAADRLFNALRDRAPSVRAHAATALARLGDPRAVEALVRTLDDSADPVRADLTLSAQTLIGLGPPVLAEVAPLLNDDEPTVRSQAMHVVRAIATNRSEGGATSGWSVELRGIMAAYEVDMARAERARLTRAVFSILREHPGEI